MSAINDSLILPSDIQLVDDNYLGRGVSLYVKRDDAIHPWISGNKWRKLKGYLPFLQSKTNPTIVTFGGAFSNHLIAVAALGYQLKINTVGIIRSYQPDENNPVIRHLRQWGMKIHYVHPKAYAAKMQSTQIQAIIEKYESPMVIPEGGSSPLALSGVGEIWTEMCQQLDFTPDALIVSLGSGGTAAGLMNAMHHCDTKLIVGVPYRFSGDYPALDIWQEIDPFAFGTTQFYPVHGNRRFGAFDPEVVDFIHNFWQRYKILLDPIYTAKTLLHLSHSKDLDTMWQSGSRVVYVHTGGLSGIMGYNYLHATKKPIQIPAVYDYLVTM